MRVLEVAGKIKARPRIDAASALPGSTRRPRLVTHRVVGYTLLIVHASLYIPLMAGANLLRVLSVLLLHHGRAATRSAIRCRRYVYRLGLAAALFTAAEFGHAEPPSFDDFYRGVSECRLDMTRYEADTLVEPFSQGVIIALPTAGAMRGLLITAFYFSPGRAGAPDQYGLVFNAPIDAVANAFPEFAYRKTVNGHLRRLSRLSDETGDEKEARKTLLVCMAGTAL